MTPSTFPSSASALQTELEALRNQGLQRRLQVPSPHLLSFAHNDYLGLARDPRPAQTAIEVLQTWGTGAQAARLISGHTRWHEELDQALAQLKQTESALTFPSGYAAATGTIPSLLKPGDYVLLDKLSHACLFDGAKLSGAYIKAFNHNDLHHAEEILRWIRQHAAGSPRILLIAESLYSMEGDFAPLQALVDLKNRYGAWLMMDEAHATGLYGSQGRGLINAAHLSSEVEIQMGTLSKAIGVHGGFIAGSQSLIDLLLHKARSFLFTTGTPPSLAAAARRSLEIIQSPEGDTLRSKLQANIALFQEKTAPRSHSSSPIQILILGSETKATEASQTLTAQGFLVPAVRHPTVPLNKARLRITLSAGHTESSIRQLTQALQTSILQEGS